MEMMYAIEFGYAALGLGSVGAMGWICYGLYKMEKETMRLLKQLEAGYFDNGERK